MNQLGTPADLNTHCMPDWQWHAHAHREVEVLFELWRSGTLLPAHAGLACRTTALTAGALEWLGPACPDALVLLATAHAYVVVRIVRHFVAYVTAPPEQGFALSCKPVHKALTMSLQEGSERLGDSGPAQAVEFTVWC